MTSPMLPSAVERMKPCPFCGGEARLHGQSADERSGYAYVVTIGCQSCRAALAMGSKSDGNGWNNEAAADTEGRAIAAWNRRTPDLALRAADAMAERGV